MGLKKIFLFDVLIVATLSTNWIGCGGASSGDPGGDAIMLSNLSAVSYTYGTWMTSGTSVAANVVHAPDERVDGFVITSDYCLIFENVSYWDSNEGVSPINLTSSLQQGVATWSGSNYGISGLAYGAVFAASDTLSVSHQPVGGDELLVVLDSPPTMTDPNNHLGAPTGLSTTFSAPDGEFDTMFVYAYSTDNSGDFGVMCEVPAADMTLEGSNRTAPLIDEDTITELESRGWTLSYLNVAYYNVEMTDDFFPGLREIPIQAGQMLSLNVADLSL